MTHESKVDWYLSEPHANLMWRATCTCGWKSAGYPSTEHAAERQRKHREAVADGTWRPAGDAT